MLGQLGETTPLSCCQLVSWVKQLWLDYRYTPEITNMTGWERQLYFEVVIFQPAILVYWRVDALHLQTLPLKPQFRRHFLGLFALRNVFRGSAVGAGPVVFAGPQYANISGPCCCFSWQHDTFLPMDSQNFDAYKKKMAISNTAIPKCYWNWAIYRVLTFFEPRAGLGSSNFSY